jgi:DNA-binding XRE family transcriptional regulator
VIHSNLSDSPGTDSAEVFAPIKDGAHLRVDLNLKRFFCRHRGRSASGEGQADRKKDRAVFHWRSFVPSPQSQYLIDGRQKKFVENSPWTFSLLQLRLQVVKTQEFKRLQKILAERVRQYRKELNLSQEDLADLAEIDRTYVSQIERAIGNPSLGVMVKVADALNVQLMQLLGRGA